MRATGCLRIAMVSYGLPVTGQKRSGVERVAHDLANGLARRGHEVTVFSYDPKPADAAYDVLPLPFRQWATSWLGRRVTMGYLGNVLALLPAYRDHDVVVAHGDSLLLPLTGLPVIRVMHGSALAEALSARTVWRFVHQLGVYPQELLSGLTQRGCVAVSRNTLDYNPLVRRVIPNGVDLTAFHPNGTAKTAEPSVVFVGTLGGRKRGQQLLDWFSHAVRVQYPNARLMMVSAAGPALPGVSYHTGVTTPELADLYRSAWVYASPSIYEGFGLPYLEALASGTPVLATPNPGSREVLADGRYGILATDEAFPRELIRLLGAAGRRHRLSRAGLQRARSYAVETMLDQYEQLIYELCAPAIRAAGRRCHGLHG